MDGLDGNTGHSRDFLRPTMGEGSGVRVCRGRRCFSMLDGWMGRGGID